MCKLLVVYNTVRSCDVYRPIIRDLICVNIRQYDASINIRCASSESHLRLYCVVPTIYL